MFRGDFLSRLSKPKRLQLTLAGHITGADWDVEAAHDELRKYKGVGGSDYEHALNDLPGLECRYAELWTGIDDTFGLLWPHRWFIKALTNELYNRGRLSGPRIELFVWENFPDEFKQSFKAVSKQLSLDREKEVLKGLTEYNAACHKNRQGWLKGQTPYETF